MKSRKRRQVVMGDEVTAGKRGTQHDNRDRDRDRDGDERSKRNKPKTLATLLQCVQRPPVTTLSDGLR